MKELSLKKKIEALCLGPQITDNRLEQFIQLCVGHQDYIYCIMPNLHQLARAAALLDGSGIHISAAIAYPLGNIPLEVKKVQIESALESNPKQIDIMMRLEYLNAGDFASARKEAEILVEVAIQRGAEVCLIANLALLNYEAKIIAAEIARDCQVGLKTASGMGVDTSIDDLVLVRKHVGPELEITACGNFQLAEQAIENLTAGADRICTSHPFRIIEGLQKLIEHGYMES